MALIDTQALDGLALAKEIRSNGATKSLPLVLISTVERGAAELKAAGIDGFVAKPVEQADLFACVARVSGRLNISLSPDNQVTTEARAEAIALCARVLVAEDNAIDREVATTMLQTLGCRVDVAVDGAQAVDAVQRERYDLVFLDCQIPHVDGYEAARQIRRFEEQGQQVGTAACAGHVPIVALTAHTAPADRTNSLESGMDDYVSKPYTMETLRNVIGRWVERAVDSVSSTSSAASTHPQISTTDDAPISDAALEEILELDRLSGGGVFARVVHIFLDEAPTALADLQSAVRDGDAAGIATIAHALKSSTLNVGATTMTAVCRQLEELGRSGTTDGAASLLTTLDALYEKVNPALKERLERDRTTLPRSERACTRRRTC